MKEHQHEQPQKQNTKQKRSASGPNLLPYRPLVLTKKTSGYRIFIRCQAHEHPKSEWSWRPWKPLKASLLCLFSKAIRTKSKIWSEAVTSSITTPTRSLSVKNKMRERPIPFLFDTHSYVDHFTLFIFQVIMHRSSPQKFIQIK